MREDALPWINVIDRRARHLIDKIDLPPRDSFDQLDPHV
jgi:hypothetical protein